MNATFGSVLALSLLAVPLTSSAQTRVFLGGGPTGMGAFDFEGGWGASLGFERRIAAPASFLLRIDGAAMPASEVGGPIVMPLGFFSNPVSTSEAATYLSLMAGLRLGGPGRVAPYLDALLGVAHVNDPGHRDPFGVMPGTLEKNTNVALSFGPGVAVRIPHVPTLFADVHYDFYFSEDVEAPIVPVRLGVLVP